MAVAAPWAGRDPVRLEAGRRPLLQARDRRAFCFEDLQHDDEFVCHGTVINQIVLPHQGVALVGEDFIFSDIREPPNKM